MAGTSGYDDSAERVYEQIPDRETKRSALLREQGTRCPTTPTQTLQPPECRTSVSSSPIQNRKNYKYCMPPIPTQRTLQAPNERKSSTNITGTEFNLQDLAVKHSGLFPLRVKIIRKKTSDSTKWISVNVGETYNIHSFKEDKALTFSGPGVGTFTLPPDAPVRCALVYTSETEKCDLESGYTFKQAFDIIRAQPMPKIVCATRMGTGKSIDSAVMPGEILRVSGVQSENQGIVAHSYRLECTKVLDGKCAGYFTTRPANVQLPLSQVLSTLNVTFPCKVQLFPASGNAEALLPPNISSRILSMSAVPSEPRVLIASNTAQPNGNLLDIPITCDIEVALLEVCGEDLLELKAQSGRLLQNEDCQKVIQPCASTSRATNGAVSQTYMTLRNTKTSTADQSIYDSATTSTSDESNKSAEMAGSTATSHTSQIKLSPALYRAPNTANGTATTSSSASASCNRSVPSISCAPQCKEKEPSLDAVPRSAGPVFITALEEKMKNKRMSQDSAITQTSGDLSGGDCDTEFLRAKYTEVKEDLEKCQSLIKDYHDALVATQGDVDHLKREIESIYAKLEYTDEEEGIRRVTIQKNKGRLSTFNVDEVLQLLDALGLSQYKKKFTTEKVSGKLLLQCDEKVLEKELGVSNKLHRLQIMSLIEGAECAYSIITKH